MHAFLIFVKKVSSFLKGPYVRNKTFLHRLNTMFFITEDYFEASDRYNSHQYRLKYRLILTTWKHALPTFSIRHCKRRSEYMHFV